MVDFGGEELGERLVGRARDEELAEGVKEGIADGIETLLKDKALRGNLRQAGLDLCADLSWEASTRLVEKAIAARIAGTGL